jgi:large subunit ribosomal protein L4
MTTTTKKEAKAPKAKIALDAVVYDMAGKKAGTVALPESVFGVPWNADLVHQVIQSIRSNGRNNTAHTKDRSEVSGGGKKPWKQKGTGRARHGSTRSPIWVGGGVAHGPRNDRNYERKINKKMMAKALYTVLAKKFQDGEMLFIDKVTFKGPKTKDAVAFLTAVAGTAGAERLLSKKENAAIIALFGKNPAAAKSFRNIGSVEVMDVKNINPLDVLSKKFLIIENPKEAGEFLAAKLAK